MLDNIFRLFQPRKVGLALGGGVARGLAHIGVLKVLEEYRIKIDYLSGTSIGALVAALYAAGVPVDKMEQMALRTGWGKLVKFSFSAHGPFSGEAIFRFVEHRLGNRQNFSELKIPLQIVATDLITGKPHIFKEGSVARAVQASTTFPGAFLPVAEKGKLLVDGGIFDNVPSKIVKAMGANFVIAVDCVPGGEMENDPKNVAQVFGRAIDLMLKKLSEPGRQAADILIEPKFPEDIWHLDLNRAKDLIRIGEAAARRALSILKTD